MSTFTDEELARLRPAWYLDAADEAGPATVDSQDNAR